MTNERIKMTTTAEPVERRMYIADQWVDGDGWAEVRAPYDDALVARVAVATSDQVDRAVTHARRTFERGGFPQWQRAEVLDRAADLVLEHREEFARLLALEGGKPVATGRVEVERAHTTLKFSAVEARRFAGEHIPMDAAPAGVGKLGVALRLPLGVVAAISPFNFPLNLVAHKIGPALAAGNTVVVKPPLNTPLSGLKLMELMIEAGLPDGWLQIICGPGRTIGDQLVSHPEVDAVTFTGSGPVGWGIRAKLPRKKVCLELGSSSPLIVHRDGDWEAAADRSAATAFMYAGQTCISIQRLLVHDDVADAFTARFVEQTARLRFGDPLDESTDVGPMIDVENRQRVLDWTEQACDAGAELLSGGSVNPDGTLQATILGQPGVGQPVWSEEVFGPLASIRRFASFDDAIDAANGSRFGLQAGVYTADLKLALRAVRGLRFGGVIVNDAPSFRTDQMPYGGVKESGNTREGPAYAIRELSDERFFSLQ